MKTIFKYPLHSSIQKRISINKGAKILCCQIDSKTNVPTLWALVDTDQPLCERLVVIVGTGWVLDEIIVALPYCGTVQQDGYVWHVFLEPEIA